MNRRRPEARDSGPLDPVEPDDLAPGESAGSSDAAGDRPRASLDALPIAGLSRRRAAWAIGAIVALWIVWVFARQIGDASAATARADQIRSENQALTAQVAALTAERELIQREAYIEQQARGFGLGTPRERPFALPADAPTPGPNAPGSAAARLGAAEPAERPFDAWLSVLFGSDSGS